MDIKIDNTIVKTDKVEIKNKIDYRIIAGLGSIFTILIAWALYKFRGVLTSKTTDSDFLNIYDIFVVILVVNIIIGTLVMTNFYYMINTKGVKGQRGKRGKRGEQGDNAKCNVYLPRLTKFKSEQRPGKNIENVVDPSRNSVSMDDKNKKYGVHYGWFPVEKKDLNNKEKCIDITDEEECNSNDKCRFRNNICINKKVNDNLNIFMGSVGCEKSNDLNKCYNFKSINTPYNKPINGAIINSNLLEGDLKAIQFMYDKTLIPSEDSDNTQPLDLTEICRNTSKLYNRGMYNEKPYMLKEKSFCKVAEEKKICSEIKESEGCIQSQCDWLECNDVTNRNDCNNSQKCQYDDLSRKCKPKDESDKNSGVCKNTHVSKCKYLSNKKDCVESSCFWDGKCHDSYLGKRNDNSDHENYDFKCQPNSAIYKVEVISSYDRLFGDNDLKPGVIKGIKFHCRDITTGKHTKIYDKNNYLNDYIVIGKEPKPDEKRYKYDSVQCNIQVDEKNKNYPGFISNISALHGNYGINGIGVNLCSYFKGLK
jgi:hypothetical protein